ncbi:DUF4402 domain-containing protein [Caulobacter sp. UNC279MFTsu5.1]|uniref:DUF4402 domain-containing protein n=1 Tax=Caulobacter sp. UNC279MFTsu5.1 TaxID=1502775 RepID=UPI0003709F30|nr:DUF4402 domain-containing protein [Caulobacter sp. UNC279MFTsu5.1]SFJ86601.1 protein of unknown function [Caulobacter sp. UNC279MFTsu5.1]
MKMLVGATAALALTALAVPAFAQSTASASGSGTATIIRGLSVTNNANLAFGTIVRPSTGSNSVVVSTAGARSITGGGDAVALGSTSSSAAQFTVAGEGGQSISVGVPASFSIVNGANSLLVTTSNDMVGSASAQLLSGSLGGSGSLVVNVGGSFPVATSTATGTYTGSFTVSSNYN